MEMNDLPLGFSFALARDPEAMKRFSNLSETEQASIVERAHKVSSKNEMQSLVRELSAQG